MNKDNAINYKSDRKEILLNEENLRDITSVEVYSLPMGEGSPYPTINSIGTWNEKKLESSGCKIYSNDAVVINSLANELNSINYELVDDILGKSAIEYYSSQLFAPVLERLSLIEDHPIIGIKFTSNNKFDIKYVFNIHDNFRVEDRKVFFTGYFTNPMNKELLFFRETINFKIGLKKWAEDNSSKIIVDNLYGRKTGHCFSFM